MLSISVVIVNYNGWDLLEPCLRSLRQQTRLPHQVLVVDNGSSDGSVERLAAAFPDVTVVSLAENHGFAAGNNVGIGRSSGDVVVLLNNDTVAEPAMLERLVEPLELDSRVGSVAAVMVFASAPEIVASAGIEVYRNGLAMDRGLGLDRQELADTEIFGASAGAAAYRRAALDDVGCFCEPFFMYLEDVDLAWRLRLRSWASRLASGAVVRHAYSASAVEGSAFKRRLLARNRLWMLARCLPAPLLARHAWRIALYDVLVVGYALAHRDWPAVAGRLAALAGMSERVRERSHIQSGKRSVGQDLDYWLQPEPGPEEMLRLRHLAARLAVG